MASAWVQWRMRLRTCVCLRLAGGIVIDKGSEFLNTFIGQWACAIGEHQRNMNTEILMRARSVVAEALEAAEAFRGNRKQLFLESHYPFFDKDVQSILAERHPDRKSVV